MYWTKELTNEIETINLQTTVYLGLGAINKITAIAEEMKARKEDRVLVITGKNSYKASGAWDVVEPVLKANGIEYTIYDEITPNPDVDQVDKGAKIARDFKANAVIAIGGGSTIDGTKAIAAMAFYPDNTTTELMTKQFIPEKALPLVVAINLTHGTSTEANPGAVVTVPKMKIKPAIFFPFLFPRYAIDDAKLMSTLSHDQTLFTSLDAIAHAVEAASCTLANPLGVAYAVDAIEHVAHSLPLVLKDPADHKNRHYLAYAAMLAGQAFTNSSLHVGHMIEHPMSSEILTLTHGLGLGVLLPATTAWSYKYKPLILAKALSPIIPNLKGEASESDLVFNKLSEWLISLGFNYKMGDIGFTKEGIPALVNMVNEFAGAILPYVAPGPAGSDVIEEIIRKSF